MTEKASAILAAATAAWVVFYMTGCMQIVGAKRINLWGAEFENNSGFEVKAGVMQYDSALETKAQSASELRN